MGRRGSAGAKDPLNNPPRRVHLRNRAVNRAIESTIRASDPRHGVAGEPASYGLPSVATQSQGDRRAVEDGATVPIYYESRLARIELDEDEKPKLDAEMEALTEDEAFTEQEKLKAKWATVEKLVGSEKRLALVAQDLVAHFEDRLAALDGKAMVVCMSRRVCVALYDEIVKLRPDWHSSDDNAGAIKIVMTGAASDPPEWQQHIGNKARRDLLAKRARDAKDPLKLVIVRDMYHGFDYATALNGTPQQRLTMMAGAIEWVLDKQQQWAAAETTEEGKKNAQQRCQDAVLALSKAYSLGPVPVSDTPAPGQFLCGARNEERGLLVQMNDERRGSAQKLARPFGLPGKWPHAALRGLTRDHPGLRPAPCLGPFSGQRGCG